MRSQGKWWRMDPGAATGLSSSSALWGFLGGMTRPPNSPRRPPEWPRLWGYTNLPLHPPVFPSCPQPSSLLIPATISTVSHNPFPLLPSSSETCCLQPRPIAMLQPLPAGFRAQSIPLKAAHLACRVADTPLHHPHGSDCSRRRRSRTPCCPLKKSSTPLACQAFPGQLRSCAISPYKLYSTGWRGDTKLPGLLSCLFCCLWVFDVSQHHMGLLQEFLSLPFPMGCLSPAPLPRQLPYGHPLHSRRERM